MDCIEADTSYHDDFHVLKYQLVTNNHSWNCNNNFKETLFDKELFESTCDAADIVAAVLCKSPCTVTSVSPGHCVIRVVTVRSRPVTRAVE